MFSKFLQRQMSAKWVFFIKKIPTWFRQNTTSTTVIICDHYGVARSLRLDFQPFWEPTSLSHASSLGGGSQPASQDGWKLSLQAYKSLGLQKPQIKCTTGQHI